LNSVIIGNKQITPSKIVCIGRNYVEHIKELGNEMPDDMVVFLKSNSAISNHLKSFHQEELHYEGELCFIFNDGRFSAVGFGLDLTKRQLQSKLKSKGLPWERAKSFDGSAVFSSFVEIDNISQSLNFILSINGKKNQVGNISLMMYKPDDILSELETFITLNNGDIVMTGTPKGVGIINKGDQFEADLYDQENKLLSSKWTAL
jgi:2-keto-4-pentenoate hydratase/2-oxohepta-3-ene-1,7-dioic acid hydratase in catechol pathway